MSADFKDYYTTLGVARDASDDDIKKAFRKLARKYHPDVATDKAEAEVKFKEINEASEVLRDPVKRKKYDQLGADWEHGPDPGTAPPGSAWQSRSAGPDMGDFHFEGTGFSDFFEQYFGGGGHYAPPPGGPSAGRSRPRRGSDIEGDILVTLDEALHGTLRPVSLQTTDRTTGQKKTQSFQVRIPPGATDGRRIRVPGQGQPGEGGAPDGDLYLRVRHAAHPDFTSRDEDILHTLSLAPWEAVLGAEIMVRTLDGTLKLRIPAAAENGQTLRIRGRGLPKGKTGERGDFLVILNVELPQSLTPEERTLWEKLRDISPFRPRPS